MIPLISIFEKLSVPLIYLPRTNSIPDFRRILERTFLVWLLLYASKLYADVCVNEKEELFFLDKIPGVNELLNIEEWDEDVDYCDDNVGIDFNIDMVESDTYQDIPTVNAN